MRQLQHFLWFSPSDRGWQWGLQRWFLGVAMIPFLLLIATPGIVAQPVLLVSSTPLVTHTTGNEVDGYPVILGDEVLFVVREGIPGVVNAEERARIVAQRIQAIVDDPTITPQDIQVQEVGEVTVVKAKEHVLVTVRENDSRAYNRPQAELAAAAAERIRSLLGQYQEKRSIRYLLRGIVAAVVSTVLLVAFLKLQGLIFPQLFRRLKSAYDLGLLGIRLGNRHLLGAGATHYLLTNLLRAIRVLLLLACFYLYVPFLLRAFPTTARLGEKLLTQIVLQANQMIAAIVAYLPNLIAIFIICLITYYAIGLVKLIISELGRDNSFTWFYPEWTEPTTRLAIFFTLAIACIIAGPYLPGFGSPVFRGLSIFLGVLFSLGSTSVIANVISGVILIYTRAFRIGDLIQIGEVMGIVIEKSLFVTRVRTQKNVVITLPNSTVLNSHVLNYSVMVNEGQGYLLVHTTVTLGYDLPWRQVHEVLIQAALATPRILSDPRPFVLQKALNDFHVSYELNAYTDTPKQLAHLYSELHQNIQDACNEHGLEILSPSYLAMRDGNHSTIPTKYLPTDYVPPGFRVHIPNSATNGTDNPTEAN